MSILQITILSIFLSVGSVKTLSNPEYCSFYKHMNCKPENIEGYQLSSSSKAHKIHIGDTLTYELVFYGGNEIIVQCCTENDFYPVHFKIRSVDRGNVIYDNKYNDYLDHINLQLDFTELMSVEITLEPEKRKSRKSVKKVSVGMAIYIEDAFFKSDYEKK
jgi:hypothetical protein